ncbi:hypothetical protein D3C85_1695380 [compost metagenome]
MLGNQANQRNQANLGVDVQRRETEEHRRQCTAGCQRDGGEDQQGVAHAFELSRQHQENECQGKGEGNGKAALFLQVLT